jgi:hypothetical protein
MPRELGVYHQGWRHRVLGAAHASHAGAFEFGDDGEASRSLFDAVAEMTGLTPMVRELEARLTADVEFKSVDA